MLTATPMRCSSGAVSRQPRTGAPAAAPTRRSTSRLAVSAIAAPIKEAEAPAPSSSAAGLEAQWQQAQAAVPAPAAPAGTTGRIVLESQEELRSTWEHRAWVGGGTLLMAATLAEGLSQVSGVGDAAAAGAAVLAAYFMADVGTAFYHW